jgi:pimeloyl-ACP methyl ester carboxylesterase
VADRKAEFAAARLIERCGHWAPEERPEYLTEQLLAFIGEEK